MIYAASLSLQSAALALCLGLLLQASIILLLWSFFFLGRPLGHQPRLPRGMTQTRGITAPSSWRSHLSSDPLFLLCRRVARINNLTVPINARDVSAQAVVTQICSLGKIKSIRSKWDGLAARCYSSLDLIQLFFKDVTRGPADFEARSPCRRNPSDACCTSNSARSFYFYLYIFRLSVN